MPSRGKAAPRLVTRSKQRLGGRVLSGACFQVIAALAAAMSCACVSQDPPSKLQQNAEAHCREQGLRRGSDDFEECVELTKAEIVARARESYQRLMREGR